MTYGIARKKPIEVKFREPEPHTTGGIEYVATLEGVLSAKLGRDYVILGVRGETYPINKEIFFETYDVVTSIQETSKRIVEK